MISLAHLPIPISIHDLGKRGVCISAGANDEQKHQEQGLEIEDRGLFNFCQLFPIKEQLTWLLSDVLCVPCFADLAMRIWIAVPRIDPFLPL